MSQRHSSHLNDFIGRYCTTPDELHDWMQLFAGITIPRQAVCPHHQAPFDYVCQAYFEPGRDLVVWAPRGGGKTRLAAAVTLADLLHKPGCSVRILGGSLEQSLRMWEHLLPVLEHIAPGALLRKPRSSRRIALSSGSSAAVLTQSERAVRGLRVQKLRCDEVELFKPQIWEAAQLVTRSRDARLAPSFTTDAGPVVNDGAKQGPSLVSGAIEAISTFHSPFGLMHQIIDRAQANRTPIIHWCLLEVLEKCSEDRDCGSCALHDECRGVAKTRCQGYVSIDDAIAMKHRVSAETWDCEMLCKRPSTQGCVFPSFDVSVHVSESSVCNAAEGREQLTLAIDFGFHSPFVCLWISDDGTRCVVVDEYVQEQRTMAEHVEQIELRPWGRAGRIACDPSGAGRNDQTAESNIQFLRRRGYRVVSKKSLIVEGLELIRAALRPAAGAPRLFIHPRCRRLIEAMQQYHYSDRGGELPLKDGTHDHPVDALRYYFVNRATGAGGAARRY